MLKAGFINVLKPTGMTSNDLVAKLRGMIKRGYGEKIKVGHTGTLDPNAAGVMLVALGNGTKFSRYVMEKDKRYLAKISFGKTTDTLDTYGEIVGSSETKLHTQEEIRAVLELFQGRTLQIPPKYSALKINGQRLYKLARENKEVPEIEAREICISEIKLLKAEKDSITIDVECSSGTYIRSLARDIGKQLDEDALLSLLIRTDLDGHKISNSWTLEELERLIENKELDKAIAATDAILKKQQRLDLKSGEKLYINGAAIKTHRYLGNDPKDGIYRVYANDQFLGIGKVTTGANGVSIKSETLAL